MPAMDTRLAIAFLSSQEHALAARTPPTVFAFVKRRTAYIFRERHGLAATIAIMGYPHGPLFPAPPLPGLGPVKAQSAVEVSEFLPATGKHHRLT